MSFASVYPLYVQKVEKKGRTKAEVDEVVLWLTGYTTKRLRQAIDTEVDFETFFAEAPRLNPKVKLIKGVICGVRIEDITDPLMKKIRYLDKLVDELAKGKTMDTILRQVTRHDPVAPRGARRSRARGRSRSRSRSTPSRAARARRDGARGTRR